MNLSSQLSCLPMHSHVPDNIDQACKACSEGIKVSCPKSAHDGSTCPTRTALSCASFQGLAGRC